MTVFALGPGAASVAAQASGDPQPDPARPAARLPAAPEGHAPLRPTGAQVRRLQRALRVHADGVFGPRTRNALERYERSAGLRPDGHPDRDVFARLRIRLTVDQAASAVAAVDPPDAAVAAPSVAAVDPPDATAARAVEAIRTQLGTPYRRAGTAPGGFDCSGLTAWAWGQAGIALPHSSYAQFKRGIAVLRSLVRAGDLVFFATAGPGASDVGLATSSTTVISATTHGVREHAIWSGYWGRHYVGARRLR